MKIAIPTEEGKLCPHFGHCESFTIATVDMENQKILDVENTIPEDGISCQSAGWLAEQGVNVVIAGGMGGRPIQMLAENGIEILTGCPPVNIDEIIMAYVSGNIVTGENSCGGEHHHCHGHHEDGNCCHH